MAPAQWQYDASRGMHYYLSVDEGCYVYQNGDRFRAEPSVIAAHAHRTFQYDEENDDDDDDEELPESGQTSSPDSIATAALANTFRNVSLSDQGIGGYTTSTDADPNLMSSPRSTIPDQYHPSSPEPYNSSPQTSLPSSPYSTNVYAGPFSSPSPYNPDVVSYGTYQNPVTNAYAPDLSQQTQPASGAPSPILQHQRKDSKTAETPAADQRVKKLLDFDVPKSNLGRRIKGTEGSDEKLDPSYRIRVPGYDFFTLCKVFKVLWFEPAGRETDTLLSVEQLGERGYSKIRWFVVVREGHNSCLCLPITTYGRKGVSKDVPKHEHAIIFTGNHAPEPLEAERPSQGEPGLLQSIHVEPNSMYDKLEPMSRINFGKVYTVEHNVKVYDFGRVNEAWKETLISQYRQVILSRYIPPPKKKKTNSGWGKDTGKGKDKRKKNS